MAYDALFEAAGKTYNVDPELLKIMSGFESSGNPSAVSPKGAAGLMQLMPDTAAEMGYPDYKTNVASNIYGGAKYLSKQLDKYGSLPLALAAYNAGPDAVDKHGGIPPYPETQDYIRKNMSAYMNRPSNMPGLPSANYGVAPSGTPVDPFAGLDEKDAGSAAPGAKASKITVDPFAGLDDSSTDTAPKGGASVIPGSPAPVAAAPAKAPETLPQALYRGINLLNPAGAALNALGSGDPTKDAINVGGGALRGAGTIGNTLLNLANKVLPVNAALGTDDASRKAGMDAALASFGADPKAGLFGFGKLGAEVAGTSGAGGAIGSGLKALPLVGDALGPLATAISSGGFSTGLKGGNALANGALRVGGGAASAAAQQALVNPDDIGKAAAIGAAVPFGAGLIGGIGKGVYNTALPLLSPNTYVGRGIAGAMSPEEAATAAANIKSAPTFVPGSVPTAAQAAGSPSLLMTEKAFTNTPAGNAAQLKNAIANNDARWSAIEGVGKTQGDLAAAESARAAQAKTLYAQAHAATGTIDQDLLDTATRPSVKAAMARADKLAKDEGVLNIQWPTPENPVISGQALDYTNRALSDMIGAAKTKGQKQVVKALEDAKEHINAWGDANIPALDTASKAYAQASVPVNTMQVGQKIANTFGGRKPMMISGAPGGGSEILGLGPYTTAMDKALKDVKYPIDPAAQGVLENVAKDLQRATISGSMPKTGSDTAYNLNADGWLARQMYGSRFQGASSLGKLAAMAAGALGGGHSHLGPLATMSGIAGGYAGASKLGKFVGGRLENAMAEHLINNPAALAPFLQARSSIGSNVTPALFPAIARSAPLALLNSGE